MALLPEDVRNKRFTPVRLREGYDMREVDAFLDEVESELARLSGLSSESDPSAATGPARASAALPVPRASTAATAGTDSGVPDGAPFPGPAVAVLDLPGSADAQGAEPAPLSVAAAGGAAARLLEIAGRSADELVAEARAQAEAIVADARAVAQRLEAEATVRVDRLESEARARAAEVDSDVSARRSLLFGELEHDRAQLSQAVEELRTFERDYRDRLRTYFAAQLATLDGAEPAASETLGQPADGAAPAALAALLEE